MASEPVWRWNVDDIWQSYSSMYRERHSVESATNDIERYHHLSASLLFGGCALESFLNTQMRAFLEISGTDERIIFKALRHTPLREKAKDWPAKIGSSDISDDDIATIFVFLDLRNELLTASGEIIRFIKISMKLKSVRFFRPFKTRFSIFIRD